MTSAAQLINQDSGDTEYYTPISIIEAAREAMGSITLDPASSAAANERVKASIYYDALSALGKGGLHCHWYGNVWMNHPYSRANNPIWPTKLVNEYEAGDVTQACCITYAATSEAWFQPLARYIQCYLKPRTNYYLPDGSVKRGVTKGSVVTGIGVDEEKFRRAFDGLGFIK